MGEDDAARVFYRDRPEWADVTPIPQDESPNPIVKIDYTEEFVDVMDYFRGIVALGERSQRMLDITSEVIARNGASCTGWYWRWKCIQGLAGNLLEELDYCDRLATRYAKNYQLWQHRRQVVEMIGASVAQREIQFLDELLEDDAKNYHMWSYRQWLVRTYGLWDEDLELVNRLIRIDVRNNSAWNERYYVLSRGATDKAHLLAVTSEELQYTSNLIEMVPNNEAAWSYARALPADPATGASSIANLVPLATKVVAEHPKNVHALALLAEAAAEVLASDASPTDKERAAATAIQYYQQLIEVDPMRMRYWAWCLQQIKQCS